MSEADTVPDRNFSFVRLPARFKARKHVGRADFRGYRRPKAVSECKRSIIMNDVKQQAQRNFCSH